MVPTEIQPFFLNKQFSDCWKILVNFQSSEKVDFEYFSRLLVTFKEEQICGSSYSTNPKMLSYSCFNPKLFVVPNKAHVSPNPLYIYTSHRHIYHINSYTHTHTHTHKEFSLHSINSQVDWGKKKYLKSQLPSYPGIPWTCHAGW